MANDFPTYTDMKRTRVIERDSIYTRPRENASIGSTQPIAKKEGLFDGISVAQIAASAAAAATSMLLASKIGIAGSVIGAAVSSAVTIVATQLYRRALSAGAKKLQNATFDAVHRTPEAYGSQETAQENAHTPYAQAYTKARSARIAPTKLQARAAAQRAGVQRKMVIASIAVAAITLAAVSGAILLATAGEGLGTRPESIFTTQRTAAPDIDDQSNADGGTLDEGTQQDGKGDSGSALNDPTGETQDQGTGGGSAQAEGGSASGNGDSSGSDLEPEGDGHQNGSSNTTDDGQKQDSSSSTGSSGNAAAPGAAPAVQ